MKESWQNLIDLIVNPRATFTRLKLKPRWGVACVVFCFLAVVLAWTTAPFTEQLLRQNLARGETSIDPIEFKERTSFVVLLVPALVIAIITWLVMSVMLTIAARIFRLNKLKFKYICAAFLHAVLLIRAVVYLINISILPVFRRVEDVETVVDLRAIPGLHTLIGPSENIILLTFLSNVHLLSVWQIVITAVAVAILAEVNKTKACITAVIIWLLSVGIGVAFSIGFAT
jgi:hypothetical protein